LATGGEDGEIRLFTVVSGENAASFTSDGPLKDLSFSENGTWLASASSRSSSVTIWNLRNMQVLKSIDVGSAVNSLAWDYTGQFLAIAAAGSIAVEQYSKSSKKWTELLRKAIPATATAWGTSAESLAVLNAEGALLELAQPM
jgi:pre-mRNA-processing factor 19